MRGVGRSFASVRERDADMFFGHPSKTNEIEIEMMSRWGSVRCGVVLGSDEDARAGGTVINLGHAV